MKHPTRILFFVIAGGLLLTLAWFVMPAREPSYQGRTLTEWLKADTYFYPNSEADHAIRHIGTNAIPTLVSYAAAKDSSMKIRLLKWNYSRTRFRLPISSQFGKQELADRGFSVLGPDAKSAVPELIQLLRDDDGGVRSTAALCLGSIGSTAEPAVPELVKLWQSALSAGHFDMNAAYALGQIGPSAQAAIPSLKAGLTNNSLYYRVVSQAALINIHAISISPVIEQLKDVTNAHWGDAVAVATRCGTNALPAVPLFLSFLNCTNDNRQRNCLSILGKFHQDPDVCIPAILPFLNSKTGDLRQDAINALCRFGKAAEPAVPALLQCLDDPQYKVRESATNALREIDPEAGAKAGIKSFWLTH